MELRQLEYFVAVAEEMHFGRAAERLHIGQPAVSQQVRRLERDLGVELFDRSPRHVRLTGAGQRFLPRARAVLTAAEEARASVSRTVTAPSTLRVGTSAGLGRHLDDLLDILAELAPQLTVELVSASTQVRLKQVVAGSLDVAFVRGEHEGTAGVRVIPIWQDRLVVAVPASHSVAGQADIALSDLALLPLRLTARRNNPPLVDLVVNACHEAGFEPVPGPTAESITDTVAAIGSGTPTWTVVYAAQAAVLRSRRVSFLTLRAPGLSITTGLAVRATDPPAALDLLLEACASVAIDDADR